MPNLAGLFDPRPQPVAVRPVLDRFDEVLAIDGLTYDRRWWHDKHFGAVNLLNKLAGCPDQPAVSADGKRVLFLDGEVYNLDEAARTAALPHDRVKGLMPCEVCLALYEAHGPQFVAKLNGQFNIAIYDVGQQSLLICNDHFADRPLYYCHTGGVLYFALELKALLAVLERSPRSDTKAVVQLFAFGHYLGDRTLFEGLSALPQGAILTADRNGLRIEQYWRPAYHRGPSKNLVEAADELGRRMVAATARRVRRDVPLGIFLSGGLDSRFVAGALARTTSDVTAFTIGPETSRDVQFGRQLAAGLSFRHRTLRYDLLDPNALFRAVWRTECNLPFTDCLSIEHHKTIHRDAAVIFNGHFGDALSGGHQLPQQFLLKNRDQLVTHILAKRVLLRGDRLRRLFRPEAFASAFQDLREAVHQTLEPLEEDRMPLLYNLWDLTVRQRRYTFSTPAVDRYLLEQLSPFLDNEVHEFALGLPVRWLFGQRCYIRAILSTFPEIAHVPWARTGRVIDRNFTVRMGKLGWDHFRRKAMRRLRRGAPTGPPKVNLLQGPRFRTLADEYLDSAAFPDALFDKGYLRNVIAEHFDKANYHDEEIGVLLTLAAGSRLFLEKPVRRCPDEATPVLQSSEQGSSP